MQNGCWKRPHRLNVQIHAHVKSVQANTKDAEGFFTTSPLKYVKGNIHGTRYREKLHLEYNDFKIKEDECYYFVADDFCDVINEWTCFKYYAIIHDGNDEMIIPNWMLSLYIIRI